MPNPYDFIRQARADAGMDDEPKRPEVTAGGVGEFVGKTLNTAATLPRQGFNVVNEAAVKPARNVLSDFGGGVMRGAGYGGSGMPEANAGTPTGAEAFRGGRGPGYGDVSGFVDDKRPDERAQHDPMTGNPQGDFMRDATDQAMSDNPVAYTGSGDFGAPGSSGTPGPGGTVNTISAEAFMNPGGKAAGDAAAGKAKRDFQLRQEGNAHLASDATADEKTAARMDEIQRELNTVNLGTNQSFSELANNKARARRLEREMASIQSGQTAAAERDFESLENQLDRQADLKEAIIDKTMGTGDLKVGGTQEAIKNKMVNEGFDSLTKEENFLVTEKIREQAISDLSKENFGEPVTQDQIKERMDLMLGQLKQAASQSSEAADQSADNLTNRPESADQVMEAILKANPGKTKDDPEVQQIYKQNLNRFNLRG